MTDCAPIRRRMVRGVAGLLLAACVGTAPAQPAALTVEVVQVVDGDSLVALDAAGRRIEVRLQGIDAPEKGQPFADVSRRRLRDALRGRSVQLLPARTDRFGRLVATVMVDGEDAGRAQIEAGMAWMFRRFADDLPADRRTEYDAAEAEARAARRGLWADRAPVAPWDYRAAQRAGTGR